jgi:aryl-alcohol dehydrogenase-like predicted oxidoreductase
MDYGISNPSGRTPPDEVDSILTTAQARGISLLDTAPAYGESERVLGGYPLRERGFKVVTKTREFDPGAQGTALARQLSAGLERSLSLLGLTRCYGLMFHHAADLAGERGKILMAEARSAQDRGLAEKIGVSVYTAGEIDAVMAAHRPDLVQLPLNVFDQRLIRSGHLKALKASGVEVHIRSVFLQGLLLMEPGALPSAMAHARPPLESFQSLASSLSLTPLQAALGFVLGLAEADIVLCGVNDSAQLLDICACALPLEAHRFGAMAQEDESLLNPSGWGKRP